MKADLVITILVVLFLLDILILVVRTSFVNAHLPRLLNLRPDFEEAVDRTIQRLERPRIRFSLRFAHILLLLTIAASVIMLAVDEFSALQTNLWLKLAVAVGCALVMFWVEAIVEGLVLRNPEAWALRTSAIASFVDLILMPVSSLAITLMGQSEASLQKITAPTDDELKNWVEKGQTDGALEKEERQMIYSIFQFGDTLAREIMIPRIDMLALDVNTTVQDSLSALVESGHSRVPVYEDTVDNIIGLLYAKDLLKCMSAPATEPPLRETLRPAYFIPEAKKLDDLLTELQTRRIHMAIVVDEYGGVAGLVTLEDIIEEIIGEIQDEYDQSEESPYTRLGEDEYLFKGSIDLDDFNEVMETELVKDNADTLGGFMYGEIGKVPIGGEVIQVDSIKLIVEQVIGRRIRKVRAVRLSEETYPEEK